MIDFSNISLPFTVNDLVISGGHLLGLIASFVLLGMAFLFVPAVIYLIRMAFVTYDNNTAYQGYKNHKQSTFYQNVRQDLAEDKFYFITKRFEK